MNIITFHMCMGDVVNFNRMCIMTVFELKCLPVLLDFGFVYVSQLRISPLHSTCTSLGT